MKPTLIWIPMLLCGMRSNGLEVVQEDILKDNDSHATQPEFDTTARSVFEMSLPAKTLSQKNKSRVPVPEIFAKENEEFRNPESLKIAQVSLGDFKFYSQSEWLSIHGFKSEKLDKKQNLLLTQSVAGNRRDRLSALKFCSQQQMPLDTAPTENNIGCIYWRINSLIAREAIALDKPKSRNKRGLKLPMVRTQSAWNSLQQRSYRDALSATNATSLPEWQQMTKWALASGCKFASAKSALIRNSEEFLPEAEVWEAMVKMSDSLAQCDLLDAYEPVHHRMALLHLERGELTPAYVHLDLALKLKDGEDESRSLYWRGFLDNLSEQSRGRRLDKPNSHWAELIRKYPMNLSSIVASASLGINPFDAVLKSPMPMVHRYVGKSWNSDNQIAFLVSLLVARKDKLLLEKLSRDLVNHFEGRTFEHGLFVALAHLHSGHTRESIRVSFNNVKKFGIDKMNLDVLKMLYPMNYINEVVKYAGAVDHALVMSLARQESSFNPRAQSPVGARGLMQVMPQTAKLVMRRSNVNLFDPQENITAGSRYLKRLMSQFGDNLIYTFASYNAGPTPVGRWRLRYRDRVPLLFADLVPYPETKHYVSGLLRNMFWYRQVINGQVLSERYLNTWQAQHLIPDPVEFGLYPGGPPIKIAYDRVPSPEKFQ